jgi:hypothetical protein
VGCSEEHCSTRDIKLNLPPFHSKNCKKYSALLHIIVNNAPILVADTLSI